MAEPAKSTPSKVKDLAPKSDAAKSIKGGAVGPCGRSAK